MACQGVPAYRYAVLDLLNKLGPLINKLQLFIMAYKKENAVQTEQTQAYFIDCKYYNCNNRSGPPLRGKLYCFIYNKEGCRSWKHTKEKCNEFKTRFKTSYKDIFCKFNYRFNKYLKQYIINYKGDDSLKDKFKEVFKQLLLILVLTII